MTYLSNGSCLATARAVWHPLQAPERRLVRPSRGPRHPGAEPLKSSRVDLLKAHLGIGLNLISHLFRMTLVGT